MRKSEFTVIYQATLVFIAFLVLISSIFGVENENIKVISLVLGGIGFLFVATILLRNINKNKPVNSEETKASNKEDIAFFILISLVISIVLGVFLLRFDLDFYQPLDKWEKASSFFNNIFSPIFLIISVVLIYSTYRVNKTELKQTQEALRRQNLIDLNAQKEASLIRMCKEISGIIHTEDHLIDKDSETYKPISEWGFKVANNCDDAPDIIKMYIEATEDKNEIAKECLEKIHDKFISIFSDDFDGTYNKRSYSHYFERYIEYLEGDINSFFKDVEVIEINHVISKLTERKVQTEFFSRMATVCYIFNEIAPENKKISALIIDCEIGWESIAMYYLYSKHCTCKGHYAVDHEVIEKSIAEIASLTNFQPSFIDLDKKYTDLF
ncbi:hypothetical protein GXP65_00515 [Vibrio campbellii]|uniref:hypothetical protein n=1 Tax=Vibrio sp. LB10LO1 TaxID=2711207 RepID=UPI00138A05FE|nr:hypothetical protein [Vibrio sp. LB10LO1]NDJ79493.1 hypothetical protein [Vibrio sp. LB10LO1]